MASRSDLLHSYQFRTRRVLAALVMRETDPSQSPLRRGVGAVFAGLMVTVLASAGFGIYGLITKVGGDAWRTPGSVIVERETGASYVYLNDTLYPTLNLASAMLAGGQPNPTIHRVASSSLADLARGNPIGIPGAPDSLPAASRRVGLPWTVCAATETGITGDRVPRVSLAVGVPAIGGEPLGDDAVLVRDARRDLTYVIWHGHRYLVHSARTVVPALFGTATPIDIGTAWLNAVPAGIDIAPVQVDRPGQSSRSVPGRANGDILVLNAETGPVNYLVVDEGLAPLTRVQAVVLNAADPSTPATITAAEVGSVPTASVLPEAGGGMEAPADVPALRSLGASEPICATSDNSTTSIAIGPTVDGLDLATPTRGISDDGTPLANRVLVPASHVAVIRAVAAPDAPTGSYIVVTDIGIAFPVPDASVLPLLGYSTAQAVDVPAPLAALLPAGPTLDRDAALTPATIVAG